MDIDGQVDSLHLMEESYSEIEKLCTKDKGQKKEKTVFPNDSRLFSSHNVVTPPILKEYGTPKKNYENTYVRRSRRRKSAPSRWNGKKDLPEQISSLRDNLAAIEKYHLDGLVNLHPKSTSLETIFEETQKTKSSSRDVMSLRKLSRSISFPAKVSPGKIEKRQLKASKVKPEKRHSTEVSLEKIRKKLSRTFID